MQPDTQEPKFEATLRCRLNPVTSLNISRYNHSNCVQLCPQVINRGPGSRSRSAQAPPSLTLGIPSDISPAETSSSSSSRCQRFVHPEGQPYFVWTSEFEFAVITEADLQDVQTKERILNCIKAVNKELQSHNISIPPRCELFLELGDDRVTCNYYFVDHVGKALFWLEDLCTELVDIPAAMSPSHLETALEQLYWVHLEFFPMHHESHEQDFLPMLDNLYNIISHGQVDRLTSRTSTFPYTADTCKQFLILLSGRRGQRVDGYTLCYAARLTGAITSQRFITFYGQQSAQLDRLQEMFPAEVVEHKWLSSVANLLMWSIPEHYNNLLGDLYVNEEVYADQWTQFVSICLTDWSNSLSWSLPVLIASVLLVGLRGGTIPTSIPPILSCAVSIASASCLHLRHQPLADSSAAVGARYLRSAKWDHVGFLPTSIAFGLPRATYLWGVALLIAQFIFIVSHSVNRFVALLAACVIAAILIFILCVVHPDDASIACMLKSLMSLCIPHLCALDAREGESIV